MSLYEDFTKKVTDVFEKNYHYDKALGIKFKAFPSKHSSLTHKSDFKRGADEEFNYCWDVEYEYDKSSIRKFTVNLNDKSFKIEASGKPHVHYHDERCLTTDISLKWEPDSGKVIGEGNIKAVFEGKAAQQMKLTYKNTVFPHMSFANMFQYKDFHFGQKFELCTKEKTFNLLEFLLGIKTDSQQAYIKHSAEEIGSAGKLSVGLYNKIDGEYGKHGYTTELSGESEYNFVDKEFLGTAGIKCKYAKEIFMIKIDQDMKVSSNYTYPFKKGISISWSDQLNLRKLLNNPRGGIDFKHGFYVDIAIQYIFIYIYIQSFGYMVYIHPNIIYILFPFHSQSVILPLSNKQFV